MTLTVETLTNTSASHGGNRQNGERTAVVHIKQVGQNRVDIQWVLEELALLASSAGARVVERVCFRVPHPHPAHYLRSGQLAALGETVKQRAVELLIFNNDLTPSQERNLEKALECRILSRSGLILDIFARRAQTREGKLQIELAQLNYLNTRLVRGWTHLERQKGGIGMHGPGESQLETDRRLLKMRLRYLEKKVEKIRLQRCQSRRPRRKSGLLTVALVGYTNAGKSTLFKALSHDQTAYCADKLFATLDPTVRRLLISGVGQVALIDTVGFVSDLPHHLVHAFRATLDEVRDADLLLHVIDTTHPNMEGCINDVKQVLQSIGAGDIEQIEVFNKIDLEHHNDTNPSRVADHRGVMVSARESRGLEDLTNQIRRRLQQHGITQGWYRLTADNYSLRARLHAARAVLKEQFAADGSVYVSVRLAQQTWERLIRGLTPPEPIDLFQRKDTPIADKLVSADSIDTPVADRLISAGSISRG